MNKEYFLNDEVFKKAKEIIDNMPDWQKKYAYEIIAHAINDDKDESCVCFL